MTFPRDSVSEPTSVVVHRWKSRACSPQLQEHEAIVSNVIEISTDSQEPLEFSTDVKLVLSHSAPNLHGYELVVFKLTHKESNEWKDIAETKVFWSLSDIEDEYPSAKDIPEFYFPVVQAEITECSTYAVVCRLKSSPSYTITSNGGLYNLPDYPSVSVTIPKNAVAPKTKIPLQIKVQEVPVEEFVGKDILVGPILRICCTEVVEFSKPVTIQLPVSLGDKQHEIPDLSACRVRVLFLRSDGEQKEWVEITGDLKNPATFNGKTVTFQVERFSGYTCAIHWGKRYFTRAIGYLSNLISTQPQRAAFFAYFPAKGRPDSQDILYLICCPSHRRHSVLEELKEDNIKSPSKSDSTMIPGYDKVYISLTGGIKAMDEDKLATFYLRFEADDRDQGQVPVRVISDKGLSGVEFYNCPKHEKDRHLLCHLNFRLPPLKRDVTDLSPCTSTVVGTSQGSPGEGNRGKSDTALRVTLLSSTPTNDELEALGRGLGETWKQLGRRLDFLNSELEEIDHKYQYLLQKGYQMLLRWKERKGADATYQVLNDSLKHKLVQRQDLAEECIAFVAGNARTREEAHETR